MNTVVCRRRPALLTFAITSALTHAASAADEPIEEVVVTASGFEQKITDAPASISVISHDELLFRPMSICWTC